MLCDILVFGWSSRGLSSGLEPWGRLSGHGGSSLHTDPSLPSQKGPPHLNDVVCRLVQTRAVEFQAWCVVTRLIAFHCHCLQGWQVGTTGPVRTGRAHSGLGSGFSHLEMGPAYPRITESDPLLHPVPEGLKAQIGVIAEVVGYAHILPATILDLEQLQTDEWRERQKRPLKPLGQVCRRNVDDHSYKVCLEERRAKLQGLGL